MIPVAGSTDACAGVDRTIGNEITIPLYADAVVVADAIHTGQRYDLAVPHLLADVSIAEVLCADPDVAATAALTPGLTVTVDEFDCAPPADLPAAAPGDRVVALLSAVSPGSDVRADWQLVFALIEDADGSLRFLGSDGPDLDRILGDELATGRDGFVAWPAAPRRDAAGAPPMQGPGGSGGVQEANGTHTSSLSVLRSLLRMPLADTV